MSTEETILTLSHNENWRTSFYPPLGDEIPSQTDLNGTGCPHSDSGCAHPLRRVYTGNPPLIPRFVHRDAWECQSD